MAQIDIRCAKCGSKNLKVRTSDRMTMHSTKTIVFCANCNACKMEIMAEITGVSIATYAESENAMRACRPLDETDERQVEIQTD